jgi:hypothetical protein
MAQLPTRRMLRGITLTPAQVSAIQGLLVTQRANLRADPLLTGAQKKVLRAAKASGNWSVVNGIQHLRQARAVARFDQQFGDIRSVLDRRQVVVFDQNVAEVHRVQASLGLRGNR